VSCYETFGWTTDDCKRVLSRYPQEAALLAIYFEELASFRGEEHARMLRNQDSTPGEGWHTDQVIGDDDEDDL
jgi:hypothetical protein